jgi:hypothetical protein
MTMLGCLSLFWHLTWPYDRVFHSTQLLGVQAVLIVPLLVALFLLYRFRFRRTCTALSFSVLAISVLMLSWFCSVILTWDGPGPPNCGGGHCYADGGFRDPLGLAHIATVPAFIDALAAVVFVGLAMLRPITKSEMNRA